MITSNVFTLVLLFVVLAAIASVCLIIGWAALRGGTQQNPRQSASVSYSKPSRYNGKPSRYDSDNDVNWED